MNGISKTTFIFLRHGEPVGGKIFRGSTDDPLTENGWMQMTNAIKNISFDEIISSPLKRCSDFSKKIQKETRCNLNIMDAIQELHLGDWEGLSVEQVEKLDAVALGNFWKQPYRYTPANAERFQDFEVRVTNAWLELCEQYDSSDLPRSVLVVCHAGVMMVLLKLWLGIPIENILCIKLNYASKIRVECYAEKFNLQPQIYIEHGYDFS